MVIDFYEALRHKFLLRIHAFGDIPEEAREQLKEDMSNLSPLGFCVKYGLVQKVLVEEDEDD